MAKWTLPEGRKPLTDADMADLTRRLADTAIEQSELYQAAKRDAEEAEAYAAELEAKLQKQSTLMDMGFAEYERRLATALDVVEWALICWDDHNKHGYSMEGDWVSDARTTLAELKGQDDE